MYLIKKVGNCVKGMGLKLMKFHGIMHMYNRHDNAGKPGKNGRGKDRDQASRSGSGNDNSRNSGNGNGTETSFAQQSNKHADKTCYCCGQKGHIPKDCSQKDKPKAQWWINKIAAQHMQTQDNESQQADQQTPGGQWNSIQMSGFSGFQMNPQPQQRVAFFAHYARPEGYDSHGYWFNVEHVHE
jgi:hypothetical protein